MRTTLDLDLPILQELKLLSQHYGESLGTIASRLLAEALKSKQNKKITTPPFQWISHSMDAKIDLSDKEALYNILDKE